MLNSFLIPFVSIFIAELLDKSQLTIMLLGTKSKKHFSLLVGVLAAFIVVDGSAVLIGAKVSEYIPEYIVKIISGLLFVVFGIIALRSGNSENENNAHIKFPLFAGFIMVFLSEWGDKTQIASGIFAAQYDPLVVFLAVISALLLLSLIALKAGNLLTKYIDKRTVSIVSGCIFIILGGLLLFF